MSLKKAKIEYQKIPKAETKITVVMLCLDGHGVQERTYLADRIVSTPKESDCGESANWTSKLIQEFIKKEFGKKMGLTGIQALLHRMEFSFTRPTYTLARADKKNR